MKNLTNNQLFLILDGVFFTLEDNDAIETNEFTKEADNTVEVIKAELTSRGIKDIAKAHNQWQETFNQNYHPH